MVPKFAGSNPAEAVAFLRATKSSARLPSEGQKLTAMSLALAVPPFATRGLSGYTDEETDWWRKWERLKYSRIA